MKNNIFLKLINGILPLCFIEICINFILGYSIYKYNVLSAQGINNNFMLLIIALILIDILVMSILFRKTKNKKEHLFLTLAIPVTILFLMTLPIFNVFDDKGHTTKAIDVSYGNLITDKDKEKKGIVYVPRSFANLESETIKTYLDLNGILGEETDYDNLEKIDSFYTYTVINSPVVYGVQAAGLAIGRGLNLSIFLSMYLARLFNVALFLVSGYYIVKFLPFGKLFAIVYLLNPMMIQSAASMGADNFTNCISLLLISYILKLRFSDDKLSLKNIIILSVFMVLTSMAKFIYFPLIFLIIILRKKIKEISKRQKSILIIGFILAILTALFWYVIGSSFSDFFAKQITGANINTNEQMALLIKAPWNYLIALFNSWREYSYVYIFGFLGGSLGAYNISNFYIFFILYILLFIYSIHMEKLNVDLKKSEKIVIIVLALILFNCVFGVEYLTWSAVGSNLIDGVQGRYFLPFLLLLPICIMSKERYIYHKHGEAIIGILLTLVNIGNIIQIIIKFV